MTDLRALADDAVQQLDRLSAVILDDVGDGPRVAEFTAAATAAREAVAKLAVPALVQVAGLLSGVAASLAANAIEWNPSLGGTLMATVDDIRHFASKAGQLSEEDNEHLHHRAAELSTYARVQAEPAAVPPAPPPAPAPVPETPSLAAASPPVAPPEPVPPAQPNHVDTKIVPISDLFYSDNGPHIVSGGLSKEAAGKSDLLGRGIDALDTLTMKPIAKPLTFAATEVVPVETLLYRGRAALERAAAIREQIKASGGAASPATLDEMYDLIGLALKD